MRTRVNLALRLRLPLALWLRSLRGRLARIIRRLRRQVQLLTQRRILRLERRVLRLKGGDALRQRLDPRQQCRDERVLLGGGQGRNVGCASHRIVESRPQPRVNRISDEAHRQATAPPRPPRLSLPQLSGGEQLQLSCLVPSEAEHIVASVWRALVAYDIATPRLSVRSFPGGLL